MVMDESWTTSDHKGLNTLLESIINAA